MSAVDAAIQKKSLTSSTTARIISNEEMEDIVKIVKSLEESGLQGLSELNKNEANQHKGRFLPVLLGTLAASILGNVLSGNRVIRAGEEVVRPGQNF